MSAKHITVTTNRGLIVVPIDPNYDVYPFEDCTESQMPKFLMSDEEYLYILGDFADKANANIDGLMLDECESDWCEAEITEKLYEFSKPYKEFIPVLFSSLEIAMKELKKNWINL